MHLHKNVMYNYLIACELFIFWRIKLKQEKTCFIVINKHNKKFRQILAKIEEWICVHVSAVIYMRSEERLNNNNIIPFTARQSPSSMTLNYGNCLPEPKIQFFKIHTTINSQTEHYEYRGHLSHLIPTAPT